MLTSIGFLTAVIITVNRATLILEQKFLRHTFHPVGREKFSKPHEVSPSIINAVWRFFPFPDGLKHFFFSSRHFTCGALHPYPRARCPTPPDPKSPKLWATTNLRGGRSFYHLWATLGLPWITEQLTSAPRKLRDMVIFFSVPSTWGLGNGVFTSSFCIFESRFRVNFIKKVKKFIKIAKK